MKNWINRHNGPLQSLKQTSGRQDDDLVVFGLKPLINKFVSLVTFPFHWVSACNLIIAVFIFKNVKYVQKYIAKL